MRQLLLDNRINHLRTLIPGWDGLKSMRPNDYLLGQVHMLVLFLYATNDKIKCPQIIPAGDGSVQLEWHEKTGRAELDFDPFGGITFLGVTDEVDTSSEGIEALGALYTWLLEHSTSGGE